MNNCIFVLVLITTLEDKVGDTICFSHRATNVMATDDIDQLWNKVNHPSWYKNVAGVWVTEEVDNRYYRIDQIPKI